MTNRVTVKSVFSYHLCSVSALRSSVWTLTRRWICPSSFTSTLSSLKTPRWPGWTPSPCPTPSLRPRTVRNSLYLDTATTDKTTSMLNQNPTPNGETVKEKIIQQSAHWICASWDFYSEKHFVMFSTLTDHVSIWWLVLCFYFILRLHWYKIIWSLS